MGHDQGWEGREMGARVSLTDQIATVERVAHEIATLLKERDFYVRYPKMVGFEIENLQAAVRTLEFMRAHEQTIRSAVLAEKDCDLSVDTKRGA